MVPEARFERTFTPSEGAGLPISRLGNRNKLVGGFGFEPKFTLSKSVVLPDLDELPVGG